VAGALSVLAHTIRAREVGRVEEAALQLGENAMGRSFAPTWDASKRFLGSVTKTLAVRRRKRTREPGDQRVRVNIVGIEHGKDPSSIA
jgi:hypothetical protein